MILLTCSLSWVVLYRARSTWRVFIEGEGIIVSCLLNREQKPKYNWNFFSFHSSDLHIRKSIISSSFKEGNRFWHYVMMTARNSFKCNHELICVKSLQLCYHLNGWVHLRSLVMIVSVQLNSTLPASRSHISFRFPRGKHFWENTSACVIWQTLSCF